MGEYSFIYIRCDLIVLAFYLLEAYLGLSPNQKPKVTKELSGKQLENKR